MALFGDNTLAVLNFALAAVLMIALVGAISSYCEKYLTTSVAQWVAHDLRRMVYQRIQRLSLAEHGESRTGDLLTRVTSDIDAVQDFITSALLGIVTSLLTLAGMLGVMFYMNWRFTLIGLSVAPLMFLVVYFYSKRIKKASRFVKKKEGELMSGVAEVLTSIQVVQAFAREDYEDRRFDWESRQNVAAGLRARSMKAKLSPMVDILVAVGTCLVLGYGARLVMAGELTHRAVDHLHLLSGQDLQAHERPLEDDQHGRPRPPSASSASRNCWTSKAACATCRARAPLLSSKACSSSITSRSATTASTRS